MWLKVLAYRWSFILWYPLFRFRVLADATRTIIPSKSLKIYIKSMNRCSLIARKRYQNTFQTILHRIVHHYWLWSIYQISGGFHKTLQRVWLANRGRLQLRTPDLVRFGTCICSYAETIFSSTCHVSGLWISNIPRYFYFAYQNVPRVKKPAD